MKKIIQFIFLVTAVIMITGWYVFSGTAQTTIISPEPEFEASENVETQDSRLYSRFPDIDSWQRPEGPLRVGLQVGHWRNSELPDELEHLRGTSLGTSGGGKQEWEVNLIIAIETKKLLEKKGVEVDILPATLPPSYYADIFIAIHADGNLNNTLNGFKMSGPRKDYTDKVDTFAKLLTEEYEAATKFSIDPYITKNMRGYYAFNWWKYKHAVHPMTLAIILETGFLTNYNDRQMLLYQPERSAQGIANAVIKFFNI